MSERRTCCVIGCDRMTVRYRSRRPDDPRLRERLRALACERRRLAYRQLLIFLHREGFVVNHTRLYRIYREERLMVRKRGGRKRATGSRTLAPVALRPNEHWSNRRAGSGQGQDPHRPALDLCARRPAIWRTRSARRGLLLFSRSRRQASGTASSFLCRADAGGRLCGFNRLYDDRRKPGPIIEAACWAHARRKFFELARLDKAPIAVEAVERIDALFAIEREINGLAPQERLRIRGEKSRPLVIVLEAWLREQRARVSGQAKIGQGHRV